jgi:hypothetical protein
MPFPNPATQFSGKRAVILGSKGGKVISKKKKWAAKFRAMKKRGVKDADIDWILETLNDPEASVFDMRNDIESLRESMSSADYIRIKQANHKLHHGEKIKTENIHHIVNWTELLKGDEMSEEATNYKTKD